MVMCNNEKKKKAYPFAELERTLPILTPAHLLEGHHNKLRLRSTQGQS